MKIIGITGGIGAGKSTVSKEFECLGATIVDADRIAKAVLLKDGNAYKEALDFFGYDIVLEDGEIDRKKLAGIVFSDKEKLEMLNKITHKHIFAEMEKQIEAAKTRVVILDVPLLFSSDFNIECDLKIAVLADEEIRIKRVMSRDNAQYDEVKARIRNQISDEKYRRMADICIVNDDLEETLRQVKRIYESV